MRHGRLLPLLLFWLPGCADVSGLSDLTTDPLPDAGPGADVVVPEDGALDALSDAPGKPDAGDARVCLSSETDCTDGIDNDCNGKTDCEEPSCTSNGYACTQPIANAQFGWYASTSTPACPGTSVATDLVTSAGGPSAQCSCSCTPQTTCPASVSVDNDENGSCSVINNSHPLTLDSACHVAGFDIQVAAKSTLTATSTCTPTATLPALSTTKGRICKSQLPKGGGGCGSAGLACLPVKPLPSFAACMIVPVSTPCPSSWPNASTVGTGVADGRTCASCPCTATGTCTGSAGFYAGNQCGTLVASVPLGSCAATNVGPTTVGSYKATVTATNTCKANNPTSAVSGSATLTGQLSLCCAN